MTPYSQYQVESKTAVSFSQLSLRNDCCPGSPRGGADYRMKDVSGCVSDVAGAECNSDHRMLRMKLAIGRRKRFGRKCDGVGVHRWDVSKLQGSNEGRELARGRYLRSVASLATLDTG